MNPDKDQELSELNLMLTCIFSFWMKAVVICMVCRKKTPIVWNCGKAY